MTDSERIDLLLDDVVRTLRRRQETARITDEAPAQDSVKMDELSLEAFINGSRPIAEIEVGKVYTTLLASNNSVAQLIFDPDAVAFLKEPNTEFKSFLRAIRRGHVGSRGENGIKRLASPLEGYEFELKVMGKGSHVRIGINKNGGGIYHIGKRIDTGG